jgi:hypothetical protein
MLKSGHVVEGRLVLRKHRVRVEPAFILEHLELDHPVGGTAVRYAINDRDQVTGTGLFHGTNGPLTR